MTRAAGRSRKILKTKPLDLTVHSVVRPGLPGSARLV